MYRFVSNLRFYCLFSFVTMALMLSGCVSPAKFEEFKQQTRSDLSSLSDKHNRDYNLLHNDLQDLESDIRNLRNEIRNVAESQDELNSNMQKWLSSSETKLKEMEDRVIEIRLKLYRTAGSTE